MAQTDNSTFKRTMLRCTMVATTVVTLSGCMGLNVASTAIWAANTAVSDLVSAERMTIVSNDLDSATPATYKPYVYRSGQNCLFSALIVPYERTWPEEIQIGDEVSIRPPELGKIAGYAAVIYKKDCPGEDSQSILRAGRQSTVTGTSTIFTRAFSSDRTTYFMNSWDGAINSQDMMASDKAPPKWWSQVVLRMIQLSETNSKLKTVLAENQALFVQVSPEHADLLRTLAQ